MSGFHRHEMHITADMQHLEKVRLEVSEAIRIGGFEQAFTNRILIAVDEAVTNIIEHGYEEKVRGQIEIICEVEPDTFTITIIDQGEAFDPRTMSDIDIQRHVAQGKAGGLGIFLIRKIMDVVDYHHETGRHNRLTMVKRR